MDSIPQVKRCTKCGVDKPLTDFHKGSRFADKHQPYCKKCDREYHAQRSQNPVIRHHESELRKNRLATIQATRDLRRASVKKYREKHPEFRDAYSKWYKHRYHNDPVFRQHVKNKSKTSMYRRRDRTYGTFTIEAWNNLCEKYNHYCLCCGLQKPLTPDHIIPIALGGPNIIENIQPLCLACNMKKHAKIIDYRPESRQR